MAQPAVNLFTRFLSDPTQPRSAEREVFLGALFWSTPFVTAKRLTEILAEKKGIEAGTSPAPPFFPKSEARLPQWNVPQKLVRQSSMRDRLLDLQCILLNAAATVMIVFVNKV